MFACSALSQGEDACPGREREKGGKKKRGETLCLALLLFHTPVDTATSAKKRGEERRGEGKKGLQVPTSLLSNLFSEKEGQSFLCFQTKGGGGKEGKEGKERGVSFHTL